VNDSTRIASLVELTSELTCDSIRKTLWHWPVIQLSWKLLCFVSVEGKILSFFTDFITTPEISGPLYISPDVYYTQITEYSLETLYQKNNSFWQALFCLDWLYFDHKWIFLDLNNDCFYWPEWSFQEHISWALPTEMIIYFLQSIHLLCLICKYSKELVIDLLNQWLQVCVHLYDPWTSAKYLTMYRVLDLSDQASYTIAFRVNFFKASSLTWNHSYNIIHHFIHSISTIGYTKIFDYFIVD
jgi:hypothetical protein